MASEFGHFEIVSEIGRGGMGIVYQALDRQKQRMVAIKQLVLENIDPNKRQEFQDRFRREAAMASRLNHPNIVSVFDVEATAEHNYYVMEYLEGHSLKTEVQLRQGRMLPQDFWPILKQVAEALNYAHALNVVHRDVKPDNVFILKDRTVKLTDFGIARLVDYEQTHLTKTGVMLGTLAYVSPEQLQDAKNVDHRADLFSLGVVCYEALSGRLPFAGDGIAGTVIKILTSEAEPLHKIAPNISVELAATIAKATRKKARDRYISVMDFAREFERSLSCPPAGNAVPEKPKVENSPSFHVYTPGIPVEIPGLSDKSKLLSGYGLQTQGKSIPAGVSASAGSSETSVSIKVDHHLARPLAVIGRKGEGNGCFLEPQAVAVRSGRIVVADTVTRRLQVFGTDGRFLHTIVPSSQTSNSQTSGGCLSKPSGLAVDFRGRIFATDSSDHYIRVFDGQGHFLKEIYNLHGKDGGLQGVVCDSKGLLYVADADNGCLQVFQSDLGTWLRRIGSKGSQAEQFHLPSSLAVDRFNNIFAVDYGLSKILVFSRVGQYIRSFGGKGAANGLFNVPRGIAVDKFDRIYVADSLNHRIQVFGPAGEWMYSFGGRGAELGKFVSPSGLSINAESGCLYVADRGNQRIQVFELKFN